MRPADVPPALTGAAPPDGSRESTAGTKLEEGAAIGGETWILRLYIAGHSPRSQRAVANLQRLCADVLDERYQLEVIDLYQQPHLAQGAQVVALPVLIKRLPEPLRAIVGDLSNTERVFVALYLVPRAAP